MPLNRLEPRLALVARQIPAGARVLDVGCGDGTLMQHLAREKGCDVRGLEIDATLVAAAMARGLAVVQGDAAQDLGLMPDRSFDIAVLSETLQAMARPAEVLAELLRVADRAIVAFPNFGHWRVRLQLALGGRMPVTRRLPVAWYETPNIHLCTVSDFRQLTRRLGLVMLKEAHLAGARPVAPRAANWRADHALFVLAGQAVGARSVRRAMT